MSDSGEDAVLRHASRRIRVRPSVVFDVGANVGHYACAAAREFGPNARIFALEPAAGTRATLLKNVADLPSIEVLPFGLGHKDEERDLFTDRAGSGLASLYRRELSGNEIQMRFHERVVLRSLDRFCEERGIQHVDFLKLDIEGHEVEALNGATRLLSEGRISMIQFEFGGCNVDSRTFLQDFFRLLGSSYQIYRVVQNGLYPLDRYRRYYELFLNTNFLAELIPPANEVRMSPSPDRA